jgi:SAM-dependent methyltransferase
MTKSAGDTSVDWAAWLASWDHQQEHLLRDREERISAIFDLIEAAIGPPRRVLDLASGPGSVTVRLLERFPQAEATLVDVDPALLAIATGVLGNDPRARIVRADLASPRWLESLVAGSYDAVVSVNALHWLDEPTLGRVYSDLAGLLRSGGVFCNADPIPPEGVARLIGALGRWSHATRPPMPAGAPDWEDWWRAAADDPVLAPLVAERMDRFGGESHPPEFVPPTRWHVAALRTAGFVEAGEVWRHGEGAIIAALR